MEATPKDIDQDNRLNEIERMLMKFEAMLSHIYRVLKSNGLEEK